MTATERREVTNPTEPLGGYADYGWIVTQDHEYDRDPADSKRLGVSSRVGFMGPGTIHPEVAKALLAGNGTRGKLWRTRYEQDDDMTVAESVVHQGRLLTLADLGLVTEEKIDGEVEFGPLTDLSQPDCGACGIEYFEDRRWKPL
jgi:hypothetical protein